jgi:hypothetical protein
VGIYPQFSTNSAKSRLNPATFSTKTGFLRAFTLEIAQNSLIPPENRLKPPILCLNQAKSENPLFIIS